MDLAAVVDLMLEQVGQQAGRGLVLHARAAQDGDLAIQQVVAQLATEGDQAVVDGPLRAGQCGAVAEGLLGVEVGACGRVDWRAPEAALERVDVVPVDGELCD